MKSTTTVIWIMISSCWPAYAAISDKYHVTDAEKAACGDDAAKFCNASDQDEDTLLSCMKANKASLSSGCRTVFDAGLRRRGLQ